MYFLLSSDPHWYRVFYPYLIGFLVICIVCRLIFNLTREKLENEQEKVEYLKKRFISETLTLKKDEYSAEIIVDKPYSKKSPWVVIKRADRGYSTFGVQYKDYPLLEIMDDELDELL